MKKWWGLALLMATAVAGLWFFPFQTPAIPDRGKLDLKNDEIGRLLASMNPKRKLATLDEYRLITERPVFFSLRRVPDVYVPPKPKPKRKPVVKKPSRFRPNFKLTALITIGSQTFALVNTGKATVRVRQGENVDDWKVSRIGRENIVLEKNGETMDLPLRRYQPVLPTKKPQQAKKPAPKRPRLKRKKQEKEKKQKRAR